MNKSILPIYSVLSIFFVAPYFWETNIHAAQTMDRYFTHDAVEDKYGVIAPWYQGQNGMFDLRIRVAAEFLKRYPWVDTDKSIMAGPHYIFNARVDLDDDGTITVLPASSGMNGNLGQRFKYISESFPRYYRYCGDPIVIPHLKIAADFLLENYCTGKDHPWPEFPISVPLTGEPYAKAKPGGFIQLDLSAGIGKGMIRAYQLTGDDRYLQAAKHWGDMFAQKCNYKPGARPWNRYANPEVPKRIGKLTIKDVQTGGGVNILLFLDELIRLGYTGQNVAILKAREAGQAYLRDSLLPAWYVNDTWGRHYWDWEHFVQGITTTGWTCEYLMNHKDLFPNWKNDIRNICSLFFHHTGVDPVSGGDVYSGAWAYPESSFCCGRQLDSCPLFLGRYLARYALEANSQWAREITRRKFILGFYNFHKSGKVEDNIDGGVLISSNWSENIGFLPILCSLEFLAWLPEFGPARENHIMRSSALVNSVVYDKGSIVYSTFDAPENTVDVLRLAFVPDTVRADGEKLKKLHSLDRNGYTIKKLGNNDCIVTIRHDRRKNIEVTGPDVQKVIDDSKLVFAGDWAVKDNPKALNNKLHVAGEAGAAMTCSFEGNQVRLVGSVDENGGLADIYIDGLKQLVHLDCWNTYKYDKQILYYRNGLSNSKHEIKIVARGQKNFLSSGTNIYIDAVQYSAATGNSYSGRGAGPTCPQRMIFGYTKRIPYIDSSGNEWLPATEFIIRSGRLSDPVEKHWWKEPFELTKKMVDSELYKYGVHAPEFWVNVTVGPGTYKVNLKFAERRAENDLLKGKMDVLINGNKVVKDLDVVEKARGYGKALDLSFGPVNPKNGVIEIRFKAASEGKEAMIQALEVIPIDAN